MSSAGINPPGTRYPKTPEPTVIRRMKTSPLLSFLPIILVKLIYDSVVLSIPLLNFAKNQPKGPPYFTGFFNNKEHNAGLKVRAFTEDTMTETTMVMANC